MIPRLNNRKANSPAMGRRARAASAELAISVIPWAFSVTAVVRTMKKEIRVENPMPSRVSQVIRLSSTGA